MHIISLQKEYWQEVVSYTIAEIKKGRTPNPDILCNQRIKFGAFYNSIDKSFDYVATGHYARTEKKESTVFLHTAPDPVKDQTYFLSHLSQEQLQRAHFPLGNLDKSQVREYASHFKLPNKDRKDSQGICFLGKLKFTEFLKYHLGEKPGDLIESETGKKIGTHRGYWYHTIGQRQGLGLSGGPWYVVAKNCEENSVFISKSYYTPDKIRDTFVVSSLNWISGAPSMATEGVIALRVKLRHGPFYNEAFLTLLDNGRYKVLLAERDQGIAQGQHAVFYDGTRCLGGGIIERYDV